MCHPSFLCFHPAERFPAIDTAATEIDREDGKLMEFPGAGFIAVYTQDRHLCHSVPVDLQLVDLFFSVINGQQHQDRENAEDHDEREGERKNLFHDFPP